MLCVNMAHQGPLGGECAGVCTVFPVAEEVVVDLAKIEIVSVRPERFNLSLNQTERYLTFDFVWRVCCEHEATFPSYSAFYSPSAEAPHRWMAR